MRYQRHFEQNVLPQLRRLSGFHAAYLLTREHGGETEIEVHTLWESLEAIRAFAGPGLEVAVAEPQAQAALTDYDRVVTHFEAREYSSQA